MTPEQQAKVIERTVCEVIKEHITPAISHEVERITSDRLMGMVQYVVRQETNRPWRWHFKVGRVEIALRQVKK